MRHQVTAHSRPGLVDVQQGEDVVQDSQQVPRRQAGREQRVQLAARPPRRRRQVEADERRRRAAQLTTPAGGRGVRRALPPGQSRRDRRPELG